MLENLKEALRKRNVSTKTYAEFLGIAEKTAYNKLNGITEFTYSEAEKTSRILFPEYDIKYLFAAEPASDKSA